MKKLPGAIGGKANDKDKDNRQNWDLKQEEKNSKRVFKRRSDILGRMSKISWGVTAQQNHQSGHEQAEKAQKKSLASRVGFGNMQGTHTGEALKFMKRPQVGSN